MIRILTWLLASPRFKRVALGWLLAAVTTTVVVVEQRDIGIARDEMVYVGSGSHYADWWLGKWSSLGTLSKADITRAFGGPGATDNNREHPPLMKTLFGFSERLLHDKLGIASELTAYRFPSAVMAGVLVLLVFLFVLEVWGLAAATIAALLTMLLPRALFHAGLAAFDAPMTTLWFATVYAYWRSIDVRPDRRRRWPWQVGVMFGLALATKHNAILLPFALVPHLLFVAWRTRGHALDRVRVLVSLLVLGPLVLVAVWPWLWFDTIQHVREWLGFHMTHVHYNFEYLGHNWNAPRFPWHVALVTTLFTVPVATLAAAVFGVVAVLRERASGTDQQRAPAILLFLSAGVSIGPFVLGSTPIFGAEKHWAPAIPAFCIAAGIGAVWVTKLAAAYVASRRPARRHVQGVVLGVVG
ncbi:MAG: glycosyltransferase family 39 protein, partial [Deltaproteobacteria bacterium]|nr:glycosyltransferase family 39 protein [Deltaproteobacteria bacterium]